MQITVDIQGDQNVMRMLKHTADGYRLATPEDE